MLFIAMLNGWKWMDYVKGFITQQSFYLHVLDEC